MTLRYDHYYTTHFPPTSQAVNASDFLGPIAADQTIQELMLDEAPSLASASSDPPMTSIWAAVLPAVPSLKSSEVLVTLSTILIVALEFVAYPLILGSDLQTHVEEIIPAFLKNAAQSYLDPIYVQSASALLCAVLFGLIIRRSKATTVRAVVVSLVLLFVVVGAVTLIGSFILKPAINAARPDGFNSDQEAILTRLVHALLGQGDDVPSGFISRQVVIAGFLIWFGGGWARSTSTRLTFNPGGSVALEHRAPPFNRAKFAGIAMIAGVSVLAVAILRISAGAHSIGGAVAGISAGLADFWLAATLLSGLIDPRSRDLLPKVSTMWSLFFAGWFIVGSQRVILIPGIVIVLAGLAVYGRVLRDYAITKSVARKRLRTSTYGSDSLKQRLSRAA